MISIKKRRIKLKMKKLKIRDCFIKKNTMFKYFLLLVALAFGANAQGAYKRSTTLPVVHVCARDLTEPHCQ